MPTRSLPGWMWALAAVLGLVAAGYCCWRAEAFGLQRQRWHFMHSREPVGVDELARLYARAPHLAAPLMFTPEELDIYLDSGNQLRVRNRHRYRVYVSGNLDNEFAGLAMWSETYGSEPGSYPDPQHYFRGVLIAPGESATLWAALPAGKTHTIMDIPPGTGVVGNVGVGGGKAATYYGYAGGSPRKKRTRRW